MKLNREQQSILYAAENNSLLEIAQEKARRNENNFTYNWTVEQHLERLTKQAADLSAEILREEAENTKRYSRPVQSTQPRRVMNYTNQVLGGYDTGE